jgi:polyhydroxyalkanoate synthesis regulator phasin
VQEQTEATKLYQSLASDNYELVKTLTAQVGELGNKQNEAIREEIKKVEEVHRARIHTLKAELQHLRVRVRLYYLPVVY